MATNPDEVAPGDEENPQPPEQETPPPEQEQPEPPTVEELARKTGWVPKEEFRGPEETWKPADQYILDGRDILRETSRDLKTLRATVDNIARTNGSIVEQEVNRRLEQLSQQYTRMVDEGDAAGALRVSGEMHRLAQTPGTGQPVGPPPEAQQFAERNRSWFKSSPQAPGDPLASALAIDVCNRLAAQGYDERTQLEAAEKEVRRQYPHLFGSQMNGSKPAASVNAPSSRSPQRPSGPKGYGDLPEAARRVADDMVERGVIKADTPQAAKELYAKNYWQNAKGQA